MLISTSFIGFISNRFCEPFYVHFEEAEKQANYRPKFPNRHPKTEMEYRCDVIFSSAFEILAD